VRLNVFNALNNNAVTARTMTSGPNFGYRHQRPASADRRSVGQLLVLMIGKRGRIFTGRTRIGGPAGLRCKFER
jgi:hypothetical protein